MTASPIARLICSSYSPCHFIGLGPRTPTLAGNHHHLGLVILRRKPRSTHELEISKMGRVLGLKEWHVNVVGRAGPGAQYPEDISFLQLSRPFSLQINIVHLI